MKGEEFSQSRISSLTIETHGEDKAEWLWGQNNAISKPGKGQRDAGMKLQLKQIFVFTDRVRNVLIQTAVGTKLQCNWLVFISLIAYRLNEIFIECQPAEVVVTFEKKSSSHRYSSVRAACCCFPTQGHDIFISFHSDEEHKIISPDFCGRCARGKF